MKVKIIAMAVFLMSCLASNGRADNRLRVRILDERGQLLSTYRCVSLSRGYAGVPTVAYKQLGLVVDEDRKMGRVWVVRSHSDSGLIFSMRGARVKDFLHEQPLPIQPKSPSVQLRKNQFYVSAHIMKDAFSDSFSTKWNSRTRTITLQRTKNFARLLRDLEKLDNNSQNNQ